MPANNLLKLLKKFIAYARRFFSSTEQSLPQIIKEALAVQFGYKKFHSFIYWKKVLIETDHQPLETIFKRTITKLQFVFRKY